MCTLNWFQSVAEKSSWMYNIIVIFWILQVPSLNLIIFALFLQVHQKTD